MSLEPIFIIGRFRTGTSALWNLYDQTPGFRAFYEPCHDGLLAHIRSTKPKPSHQLIEHYWSAYEPIMSSVEAMHSPAFGITRLVLERDEEWPELQTYLQMLIDAAGYGGERPVLQFNRMDFRLPWLRAKFPDAKIVYLYRNSREQWASMISHLPVEVQDHPLVMDAYELTEWSCGLSERFPFLADPGITTSYERAFLIWQLSGWMGQRLSDLSLSFDREMQNEEKSGLSQLAEAGLFPADSIEKAKSLFASVPIDKAEHLHDSAWFASIEEKVEKTLAGLGLNTHFGRQPLSSIRIANRAAWQAADTAANLGRNALLQTMLQAHSLQRSEITRLLGAQQ